MRQNIPTPDPVDWPKGLASAMSESTALTNAPELTVSELSGALKRAIEDQFGHVRLRGEISNYRGHIPPATAISP